MTKQLNLTVLQWYEMLPVKLRDKAQAYAMDAYETAAYQADNKRSSLVDAVWSGLFLADYDEGFEWFRNIANNAPRYQSAYIKKHKL